MSQQSRSALQTLYGTSGSQFPNNNTGYITPAIQRAFGQDNTDSHFNLITDKYTGAQGVYLNGVSDTTTLASLVTAGVTLNIIVFYADSNLGIRQYQLVDSTDAEVLPYIVHPGDYNVSTNHKVWKLLPINGNLEITLDIGDWNINSSISKTVAHGLTLSKIRFVTFSIRNDGDTLHLDNNSLYATENTPRLLGVDATYVNLSGTTALQSTDFDATSYNRGWIKIEFIP